MRYYQSLHADLFNLSDPDSNLLFLEIQRTSEGGPRKRETTGAKSMRNRFSFVVGLVSKADMDDWIQLFGLPGHKCRPARI